MRISLFIALAPVLALTPFAGAAKAPPADPSEIICKQEARRTLSRFTKKTCRTKAEWDAIAELARNELGGARERLRHSLVGLCGWRGCSN